jgi:hypothetical protein
VAAAVVADRPAHRLGQRVDVGEELLERPVGELGGLLERRVQVGDVRLVVLAVVDLHGLRVDVRLEHVGRVGKRRERVRHRGGLRR